MYSCKIVLRYSEDLNVNLDFPAREQCGLILCFESVRISLYPPDIHSLLLLQTRYNLTNTDASRAGQPTRLNADRGVLSSHERSRCSNESEVDTVISLIVATLCPWSDLALPLRRRAAYASTSGRSDEGA